MRVDDQGVTRYGADHKDLDNSIGADVQTALQEAVLKLGACTS